MNVKEFIKKNKEKIFIIFFTLLYAIITAILAFHHENWRDENQVWLLCKNLSITDLLVQLKYEGHPIVWFALIFPFAKLGFSCKILNIISWIVMVTSVFIILKKAPFSKIAKIAIIITFPFMYQYVIVARNYSLIVLFVTLICLLDYKRKEHPILYAIVLALLANTHLIMVGLVGMITITFYIYELTINRKNNTKEENSKLLKGFLIVVVGGIILLIQLIRCLTVASELPKEINIAELIKLTIYNLSEYAGCLIYSNKGKYIIDILFLLFIAFGIWDYRKETIIFAGAVIFQCLIYSILGIMELYMGMSILLILIYVMWTKSNDILENNGNKKIITMFEIMLIIISLLSIPKIKSVCTAEYKFNYSSAPEMAQYINENIENNAIIIADRDAECSSMIPYIKNNSKFWNVRTQQYYTYVTWNWDREREITGEEVEKELKENFVKEENLYYIYCTKRNDVVKPYLEEKGELTQLYKTNQALMDEQFIIYKIQIK